MRAFFFLLATIAIAAHADDARLSGSVSGPDGKKMAGVTISAKAEASTIKTSVFTDASGNYRFSPLPQGSYRVWAQAIGYQTAKAELALSGAKRQDFRMKANADAEQTFRPPAKRREWRSASTTCRSIPTRICRPTSCRTTEPTGCSPRLR